MARRALLVLLAALAGCQSYNFNPVGKCVIQPGTARFQLNATSVADVLFVVDDSGSMASNQDNLARNFGAFIDDLATTQKDRAARGLDPLEFHLAITTSSVYENFAAQGNAACTSTPSGPQCSFTSFLGTPTAYACTAPNATPPQICGDLIGQYWSFHSATHGGCIPGPGVEGRSYPAGDFVSVNGNPKVLHFTKDLDWSSWGTATPDPRITDLVARFQQNIAVGTCGSGQEQHLEGGRLAIQKALRQGGKTQPPDVAPSEFPHDGAKLVVVFVGDEDDCSGPADPNLAVQTNGGYDVQDTCVQDWRQPDPAKRKEYPPTDYAKFLLGLGRPVGAAFIYSSNPGPNGTMQPGLCGCPVGSSDPSLCHGKSSGTRMHELATALAAGGAGVIEASICDASFASTLKSIAELVKPPAGLQLPSQPAAGEVTVLRIVSAAGATSRVCSGPGASADWWFVDCADGTTPSASPTTCIAIRPGSGCEANPGESYSAEYLGVVPAPTATSPGGCGAASTQSSECAQLLGGRAQDWRCDVPSGQARGTCLCNGS